MTKTCSVCKQDLPIESFGPKSGRPHARPSCRGCDRAYQQAYYRRNLEKSRQYGREQMAARRSSPEGRDRLHRIAKRTYQKVGRERQREYLSRLKREQFFKWKARRSYIRLTEQELESIWAAQGGLCALTGRVLDESAEIDHIIPKTRGGSDAVDNSRWVCRAANQAKRDLLDEEFYALCAEILEWRARAG